MISTTLAKIWKAFRHDPRNLIYPFRYPRHLLKGIYLFNGNRIRQHPSARIYKEGGTLQFGCFWHLWRQRGGIILHENSSLHIHGDIVVGDGVIIEVHAGASLEIGAETFINPNSYIISLESIHIGNDCAVAWNTQIMDGDRHFFLDDNGRRQKNTAPIHIGDHVWIGSGCSVLKGASIGNGAVIGAGSIVTGQVPAQSVVAGNPLRNIREGIAWEK